MREIQDRNKPHCFELYACGGADIIKACKTDSEGKVSHRIICESIIFDFSLSSHCLIININESIIKQFSLKKKNYLQVVEGKHTVYRMSAAAEEDKLEWIKCLKQSISHNPFYDILVQRKKKALANS